MLLTGYYTRTGLLKRKEHNAMLSNGGRLASRSDSIPDARHPVGASKRLPTIMQHD